jgi:hypothetical protein
MKCKHIQDFGAETFWKMLCSETKKIVVGGGNVKTDYSNVGYEDGKLDRTGSG